MLRGGELQEPLWATRVHFMWFNLKLKLLVVWSLIKAVLKTVHLIYSDINILADGTAELLCSIISGERDSMQFCEQLDHLIEQSHVALQEFWSTLLNSVS